MLRLVNCVYASKRAKKCVVEILMLNLKQFFSFNARVDYKKEPSFNVVFVVALITLYCFLQLLFRHVCLLFK